MLNNTSIMLGVIDKCLRDGSRLPKFISQNQDSSIHDRPVGGRENLAISKTSQSSSDVRNNQEEKEEIGVKEAALDTDPMNEAGTAKFAFQEPHKSSRFVNLQKVPVETTKRRPRLVKVKEYCPVEKENNQEEQGGADNTVGTEDERPFKSLHWSALRQPMAENSHRHQCKGPSWACEKCRHIYKVKKTTQRFQTLRSAKEVLAKENISETNTNMKAAAPESAPTRSDAKLDREGKATRHLALNARTVAQKSRDTANGAFSCLFKGGNSKWAQPVLGDLPRDFYNGKDADTNALPRGIEMEHGVRKTFGPVFRLKFVRDYLEDEPDYESEIIFHADLAPRPQKNAMSFIPPGVYEPDLAAPKPLKPRIRIFDMSSDSCDDKLDRESSDAL